MNRKCKDCGNVLPIKEFASAGTINGVDYFRHKCVSCYSKSKSARKVVIRDQYYQLKKTLKCINCGNNDFRVLEFDHLDPNQKDFSVGEGLKLGYSFDRILNEIEKCQVLCANCHRIKTFEEGLGKN